MNTRYLISQALPVVVLAAVLAYFVTFHAETGVAWVRAVAKFFA